MQIEIGFDVFQALTALRTNEADSYNDVIRRLLKLPSDDGENAIISRLESNIQLMKENPKALIEPKGLKYSDEYRTAQAQKQLKDRDICGAWFGNTLLPWGTKLRATYKGQTHYAEIRDRKWIGEDGIVRNSPSDAANAISKTNVNGWRFWFAQLPGNSSWQRLAELRK
jgi:predicted CopG family antitoxin